MHFVCQCNNLNAIKLNHIKFFYPMKKLLLFTCLFIFLVSFKVSFAVDYYPTPESYNANLLSSWQTQEGVPLVNFNYSNQIFYITKSMGLNGNWSVPGNNSMVVITSSGRLDNSSYHLDMFLSLDSGGIWNQYNNVQYNGVYISALSKGRFNFYGSNNFRGDLQYPNLNFFMDNNVSVSNLQVNGDLRLYIGYYLMQLSTTTATIGGNILMDQGTWNSNSINLSGSLTNGYGSINSTVNFLGSNASDISSYGTIRGFNVASTKTLTLVSDIGTTQNVGISGTLICGTRTVSGTGDFDLFQFATIKCGAPGGLNGNITKTGIKSFYSGTSYEFNGTSAQVTGSLLPDGNIASITFKNSAGVTLSKNTSIGGRVAVDSGCTLNLAGFNMQGSTDTSALTGKGTVRTTGDLASQISGLSVNTFSGAFEFTGSSQSVPAGTYPSLTVNGTGTILGGNVTLTGALTLASGTLTLGANDLTVGSLTGGSPVNYVVTNNTGRLTINNVGNTDVLFPVGSNTYSPVVINNAGTPDNFSVNVSNTIVNPTFDNSHAVQRQFNISETTPGASNCTITLGWYESNEGSSFNRYSGTLYIGHWDGGSSMYETFTAALDSSENLYTATTTGVTNFSPFIVSDDGALPVELSSFTSVVNQNSVKLNWSTVTETNNSGFDIEKKLSIENNWKKIGNVAGNGNSNEVINYSYTESGLAAGKYNYRLKQIDFNGNFEYHNLTSEVIIGIPNKFELSQNYPNPFNPSTIISYQLANNSFVSLSVYDISGREISKLVNIMQTAGYYTVNFNGANLSSGMYFYILKTGEFTATKKMLLVK